MILNSGNYYPVSAQVCQQYHENDTTTKHIVRVLHACN